MEAGSGKQGARSYPGAAMREPARSFTDLEVWQNAHAFVLAVYGLTRSFPQEERFGLVSQFRRAAVSIPANMLPASGNRPT